MTKQRGKRPSRTDRELISQEEVVERIYPYILRDPSEVTLAKGRVRKRIGYAVRTGALTPTSPRMFERVDVERWAKGAWPGVDGSPGPGERAFAQPRAYAVRASAPRPGAILRARTLYLPCSPEGIQTAHAIIAEQYRQNRVLQTTCSRVEAERDEMIATLHTERRRWSKRETELLAELEKRAPPRVFRRLRGERSRKRS